MKNKAFKIISLALALLMLAIGMASCNTPPSEGTDSQTEEATESESETEIQYGNAIDTTGGLRILITSDVHHNKINEWYGLPSTLRMRYWVEAIKKEHAEKPFDLIIIAGDTSLDHIENKGEYKKENGLASARTKEFVDKYVSALPKDVPVFILPGNHEQFSNEQWKQLTGNERQGSVVVEGNLFIMLDNYNSNLEPNRTGDPQYTPSDVEFIKSELAKNPDCKNVWLVAHHFDPKLETDAFKELLKTEKRIKGLFSGHTHKSEVISLGADFGGKKLAQTGEYSYSYYAAMNEGNLSDVVNSFWGFRDLVITDEYAMSQYIIPAVSGPTVPFKGSPEPIKIEKRKTVHSVRFY